MSTNFSASLDVYDSVSVVKDHAKIPEDLVRPPSYEIRRRPGGADRARTDDLRLARAALSQLSYCPEARQPTVVGLSGLEPLTSRLSGVRSSQLSYRPWQRTTRGSLKTGSSVPDRSTSVEATVIRWLGSVRKEVIQPQVLLRLPCYDFTPIADHTFDSYLPVKGWPTGFWCNRLS